MSQVVMLCGATAECRAAEGSIAARLPGVRFVEVAEAWDLTRAVSEATPDLVVMLRGSISEHERRVDAVTALRRDGFAGRILYAGAFLTEKTDALAAGADLFFDPASRAVEDVVTAALVRPIVAADHPYLRYLLVSEWADVVSYGSTLPSPAPAILLAATSCHRDDAAFWSSLADYARSYARTQCIVVEDDDDEDTHAEALTSGVQPYVVLKTEGLQHVHALVRRKLREAWLSNLGI